MKPNLFSACVMYLKHSTKKSSVITTFGGLLISLYQTHQKVTMRLPFVILLVSFQKKQFINNNRFITATLG